MGDGEDRIRAAESRMRAGQKWFRRFDSHSWEDVREFVGSTIRNPGEIDELFALVRAGRNDGYPIPAAMVGLDEKLWKAFRLSFETDPISAMAAIIVPHEDSPFSWKVFTTDPLTANFHEGRFGYISGPPRSGKTNVGCVILERARERGFVPFSNIELDVEGYVWTPTAKDLIRAGIECARKGQRWVFVLDEGGASGYTRQEWYSARSRDLNKFVKTPLGKLRGNLILIEQDPKSVPPLIVEWATSKFHCPREGWVSIDLRGPDLVWRQDVRDFPRTSLPYETRDMAIFRVDVDVDAMLQATAGADDQLAAMLTYIDRPTKGGKSLDPRPRDPTTGEFVPRKQL